MGCMYVVGCYIVDGHQARRIGLRVGCTRSMDIKQEGSHDGHWRSCKLHRKSSQRVMLASYIVRVYV